MTFTDFNICRRAILNGRDLHFQNQNFGTFSETVSGSEKIRHYDVHTCRYSLLSDTSDNVVHRDLDLHVQGQ